MRKEMEDFNFGLYLRELRTNRKLSLHDVEKACGVSNPYLSQLERGDRPSPSPEILKKLARAYQIPVRELFLKAGYLDEPEVTATEEERIEAAFPVRFGRSGLQVGSRESGVRNMASKVKEA